MGISSGTSTRWLFVHCVQIVYLVTRRNVFTLGDSQYSSYTSRYTFCSEYRIE